MGTPCQTGDSARLTQLRGTVTARQPRGVGGADWRLWMSMRLTWTSGRIDIEIRNAANGTVCTGMRRALRIAGGFLSCTLHSHSSICVVLVRGAVPPPQQVCGKHLQYLFFIFRFSLFFFLSLPSCHSPCVCLCGERAER
ncbi:hypothetical protein DQ04_04951060 [Trypanosoma grayi]|uniref:hypothetical protein n=1 Tax=Trypanosoma grayi TaxID=71804 RepID=UPI0004F41425|nr:hypothetical protein DQ04_04951060 [Trypanosoma grayi]KEG09611.1 hypothetical protein DQ04_04951060 [Trypanosoma grayi]